MNHDNPLCAGCGACCRDAVPIEAEKIDGIVVELREFDGERWWMRRHADSVWCAALDLETRTCTVYENRPRVCREFVVAGPQCGRARTIIARLQPTD